MKVLGVGTLSAILPILVIGLATVLLAYWLGRLLLDHRFGLLAGTALAVTPEFVKGSRNPMLEPALMFFIMLAVCFHVVATRPERFARYTVLSGVSLGLALLAKGPPGLLALAVIIGFQVAAHVFPDSFGRLALSWRRLPIHVMALVLVSAAVVMLVDLWHRGVAGASFVAYYVGHQLRFTILEGRGAAANDWTFYLKTFLHYWPWWPFVLASVPIVVWTRDRTAVPALVVGGLVTGGTYLGFSLIAHKFDWYTSIHFVGSSLLAALVLRRLVSAQALDRHFRTLVLVVTLPALFLSASVPSLFLQYERPLERFMERAHAELGGALENQLIADCVPIEPRKGPLFLSFYLGARMVECGDSLARFKLVDSRAYVTESGHHLVFAERPYAIFERPPRSLRATP
jgi:4-amino-4-deoxy-L-arabinose transferase-like glycosyltransferase